MIDEMRPSPVRGYLHPALALAGVLFAVALLLTPFAASRSGSAGLGGLAVAGLVCLFAGWIAEAIAFALAGRVAPVGIMLLGMAVRVLPPLAICVGLLATGQSGRSHLPFISYLLAFYLVTLTLETYTAVRRLSPIINLESHPSAGGR
jgi:hypothetical protein